MADDQQTNLRNRIAAKRAEPAFQAFAKAMEAPVNLDAAWAVFYREAADICDEAGGKYAGCALNEHAAGAFDLMETFLRKANEAEYVATPCDPMVPCEDGGEPCHVHERLMAHAEGDHELCEPDCGPAVPVSSPPPDQTAEPVCMCGHPMRQHHEDVCLTKCGCQDGREPEAAGDLADRLEAALTARFTELGNPFSRMRIAFQGPDGWPASKGVSPHDVALVLRELLATGSSADDGTGLRLPNHTVNEEG